MPLNRIPLRQSPNLLNLSRLRDQSAIRTPESLSQQTIQRATQAPNTLQPADILMLQRTVGNAMVQRLLAEAKAPAESDMAEGSMTVGAVDDAHEQEADSVARSISMGASTTQRLPDDDPLIQGGRANADVERALQSPRGGRPLPDTIRRKIEPRLGADLGGVQVHTDSHAADLNRQLHAKAFTHGNHIYYGKGQSPHDMHLTTHEAVHTVQQGASPTLGQNGGSGGAVQRLAATKAPGIQRLSLMIGDPELEQKIAEMPKFGTGKGQTLDPIRSWGRTVSGDEGKSFLSSEEKMARQDASRHQGRDESVFQIRDKWGDRYLEKHNKQMRYNPMRIMARMFGGGAFGKRRSFKPGEGEKYLEQLGPNEDLNIISHGGGDKIGGYTPAKLVRLLKRLGLDPREHRGAIWLRGCLAAYRPKGEVGSSFVEKMDVILKQEGYRNPVYGLVGLAQSHTDGSGQVGREEEFNPVRYGQKSQHEAKAKSLRARQAKIKKGPSKWDPRNWFSNKGVDWKEHSKVGREAKAEEDAAKNITFHTGERNWVRGSDYQGIGPTPIHREPESQQPSVSSSIVPDPSVISSSYVPGPPSPEVEKLVTKLTRAVGIDTVFGIKSVIDEVVMKRVSIYQLPSFLIEKLMTELELEGTNYDLALDYVYQELAHRGYRFLSR